MNLEGLAGELSKVTLARSALKTDYPHALGKRRDEVKLEAEQEFLLQGARQRVATGLQITNAESFVGVREPALAVAFSNALVDRIEARPFADGPGISSSR